MRLGTGMQGAMSAFSMGLLVLSLAACLTCPASAQNSLAEKSQNPIGDLISVPLQTSINFGVGNLDKITYHPPVFAGDSYDFGIGDIQLQTYFVPKKTVPVPDGSFVWGVGPVLQADSATDSRLGTGKWAAGAGAVVFFAVKSFT